MFFQGLQLFGIVTPDDLEITEIADDPDDDKFLICAVEGAADYIVSGDPHRLNVESYQEIPIMTPRQFLDTLFSQDSKND